MSLDGIRGADDALRRFLHLSETCAGDLRSVSGAIFDARLVCDRCGGGPSTWSGPTGRAREICASCGVRWSGRFEGGPRDRIQGGGDPDRRERDIDLLSRLRPLILTRPRALTLPEWGFDLVCLGYYLDSSIGTYERVADAGARELPAAAAHAERHWTPATVRSSVARARRTLDARLERAKRPRSYTLAGETD